MKGEAGIEKIYNEEAAISKRAFKRSFAELKKNVHTDEICEMLTSANYRAEAGLLMASDKRILFVSRRKNSDPVILQFNYEELTNVFREPGVIAASLRFVSPLYETKLDYLGKKDSKKLEALVWSKIKNRISAKDSGRITKNEVFLDQLFEKSNGWTFSKSQVPIYRFRDYDDKIKFNLFIGGIELTVTEDRKYIGLTGTKQNEIKSIVIYHVFTEYELVDPVKFMYDSFYRYRTSSFSLNKKDQLVISTTYPVLNKNSIQNQQKHLLSAITLLTQQIIETRKNLKVRTVQKLPDYAVAQGSSTNSINWSDVFDFIENAAEVVQTVGDIANVILGEDEGE